MAKTELQAANLAMLLSAGAPGFFMEERLTVVRPALPVVRVRWWQLAWQRA